MKRLVHKIFLFVATMIVLSHSIIPHFHYQDEHELIVETHDGQDDHQHLFSFVQLDNDFLPSQLSNPNIHIPVLYLLNPAVNFQFILNEVKTKTQFGYYKVFPPPDKYFSSSSRRGPPTV